MVRIKIVVTAYIHTYIHTYTALKGLLAYERWTPFALSQQTRDRARSHCPNDAVAQAEDT